LRFGGRLVEQLGAQLYPRVTASVAELVSNAWDADAAKVWITIPFDEDWKREGAIEVLDDGNGMTREQASGHYLIVA
jgi:DNA mismatch repair ATPase MutL